jgi:hypothetical protein
VNEAEFHRRLREATADAKSILDLGAGTGRMREFYPERCILCSVDICVRDLFSSPARLDEVRVVGFADEVLPMFGVGRFSIALGLDFIEHMRTELAIAVITEMKRVAHRVCLFVPEGEHPQAGTPENPFQEHLSTWDVGSLARLGFEVALWPEFHSVPGKSRGAMWATWPARPASQRTK